MLKDVVTSTSWKASAAEMAQLEAVGGASLSRTFRSMSPDGSKSPGSPWAVQAVHDTVTLGTMKRTGLSYSQQYERRCMLSPTATQRQPGNGTLRPQ